MLSYVDYSQGYANKDQWQIQGAYFRSSHPEVFLRKCVMKICSKFKGEHPCRSVIIIKLLCNFIEITLRQGCSPVNLQHIIRTLFPKNTSKRLLQIFWAPNFLHFYGILQRTWKFNQQARQRLPHIPVLWGWQSKLNNTCYHKICFRSNIKN